MQSRSLSSLYFFSNQWCSRNACACDSQGSFWYFDSNALLFPRRKSERWCGHQKKRSLFYVSETNQWLISLVDFSVKILLRFSFFPCSRRWTTYVHWFVVLFVYRNIYDLLTYIWSFILFDRYGLWGGRQQTFLCGKIGYEEIYRPIKMSFSQIELIILDRVFQMIQLTTFFDSIDQAGWCWFDLRFYWLKTGWLCTVACYLIHLLLLL